jgi:hypothetical protein
MRGPPAASRRRATVILTASRGGDGGGNHASRSDRPTRLFGRRAAPEKIRRSGIIEAIADAEPASLIESSNVTGYRAGLQAAPAHATSRAKWLTSFWRQVFG